MKRGTVIRQESRQDQSQKTYPGVARQALILRDSRVPLPGAGLMLEQPHTGSGVLPTHRRTGHGPQPVPHPRVGEPASAKIQEETVSLKSGHQPPLFPAVNLRCLGTTRLAGPHLLPLEEPVDKTVPSPAPSSPADKGPWAAGKNQHALPLPWGTQNLPN